VQGRIRPDEVDTLRGNRERIKVCADAHGSGTSTLIQQSTEKSACRQICAAPLNQQCLAAIYAEPLSFRITMAKHRAISTEATARIQNLPGVDAQHFKTLTHTAGHFPIEKVTPTKPRRGTIKGTANPVTPETGCLPRRHQTPFKPSEANSF
jgi:hypothetical protein